MKKILKTLMIMLLMIPCMLGLAACGNNKGNGNNGEKSWPTINYITNAEKYSGDGEITRVNSWDDGSCSIYINNSNESSVSAYRIQLENAGWTLSVGPVTGANNTAWGYTKDSATCSIRLYTSTQTEERSSGNYSFNLFIGFENDGIILPPSANTLTTPVVSINASGLASWSAVSNAVSYKYVINSGEEQSTTETSVQLTDGQNIKVKAIGNGTTYNDSAWSTIKTYSQGGSQGGITASDFDCNLGNHYYISLKWDITTDDGNDNEYTYQEYRKIALINGVYFTEKYDYNYEQSGAQEHFSQTFYISNGSNYDKYVRYSVGDSFEQDGSIDLTALNSTTLNALTEIGVYSAKTYFEAAGTNYFTAGATTTHATGKPVKKYTYSVGGYTTYDFYIETTTKACIEFVDHINDGHKNSLVFSTSGNIWGTTSGLPSLPTSQPQQTTLQTPVVSINASGLASWSAVSNAQTYKIKVDGGDEEFAVGMSEQLTNGQSIQVKAIGEGETYLDSAWSTIQTYTAGASQGTTLSTPVVSIDEYGLASWSAVSNAISYSYIINSGDTQSTTSTSVQLYDGETITVRAIGNGTTYTNSGWSTIQTYIEETVSPYTWPTTALADYGLSALSQPTGSTIDYLSASISGINIQLSNTDIDDYTALKNVIIVNYTITPAVGERSYYATNNDGQTVYIYYSTDTGTIQIILSPASN